MRDVNCAMAVYHCALATHADSVTQSSSASSMCPHATRATVHAWYCGNSLISGSMTDLCTSLRKSASAEFSALFALQSATAVQMGASRSGYYCMRAARSVAGRQHAPHKVVAQVEPQGEETRQHLIGVLGAVPKCCSKVLQHLSQAVPGK